MDYRLLADEVLLKFLKISDELAFEEIYLRYAEEAQNPDNYRAAVASMGGDGLTQRIFWDKP